MNVTKDPSCGCCDGWVAHIEAAGFPVRVVESTDMDSLKQRLGVPAELASCHTAEVGGYVVEGHVPAAAIRRLLAERPDATGWPFPECLPARPAWIFRASIPSRMKCSCSARLSNPSGVFSARRKYFSQASPHDRPPCQ